MPVLMEETMENDNKPKSEQLSWLAFELDTSLFGKKALLTKGKSPSTVAAGNNAVKLSDICEQVTALNVGLEMSYPE
jgi:hypothetical protein